MDLLEYYIYSNYSHVILMENFNRILYFFEELKEKLVV